MYITVSSCCFQMNDMSVLFCVTLLWIDTIFSVVYEKATWRKLIRSRQLLRIHITGFLCLINKFVSRFVYCIKRPTTVYFLEGPGKCMTVDTVHWWHRISSSDWVPIRNQINMFRVKYNFAWRVRSHDVYIWPALPYLFFIFISDLLVIQVEADESWHRL